MYCYQMSVILAYLSLCYFDAVEIAREVDGGVELLGVGSVELIVPDKLSFTLKSPEAFHGEFKVCYKAITTFDKNRNHMFYNYFWKCQTDSCILMIHSEFRAHGMLTKRQGDTILYEFNDDASFWCPRLVENGRMNFTVIEMPSCPVIVNGASLPKKETANAKFDIKWVIVICVLLILILLIVIGVGIYICIRSKKKSVSPLKSVKHIDQNTKSPIPPTSHRKTSPAISASSPKVLPPTHQNSSNRNVQVNSSNSI